MPRRKNAFEKLVDQIAGLLGQSGAHGKTPHQVAIAAAKKARENASNPLSKVSIGVLNALCLCAGSRRTFQSKSKAAEYLGKNKPSDEAIRAKFSGTSTRTEKFRDNQQWVARHLGAKGDTNADIIESIIARYHWYRNTYNL